MSKRILLSIALVCFVGGHLFAAVDIPAGSVVQIKVLEANKYFKVYKGEKWGHMRADADKSDPGTRFVVARSKEWHGFLAPYYDDGRRFMSAVPKGRTKHSIEFKRSHFKSWEKFKVEGDSLEACFLISNSTKGMVMSPEGGGFAKTQDPKPKEGQEKGHIALSIEIVGKAISKKEVKNKFKEAERLWSRSRNDANRKFGKFRKWENRTWNVYRKQFDHDFWRRERRETNDVFNQLKREYKNKLLKPEYIDSALYDEFYKKYEANRRRGLYETIIKQRINYLRKTGFLPSRRARQAASKRMRKFWQARRKKIQNK